MAPASIVFGALGLILTALTPAFGIVTGGAGLACALIAVVLGVAARKSGAGKAGLSLGVLCLVGGLGFFFLFMGRADVSVAPVAVPAQTPATLHP